MTLDREVSLNLSVRGLGQSATLAINDLCREMRRAGRTVYRLGLGQSPFPVPLPVVEELKAHADRKDYLPAAGLPELREAVADYHRRTDGIPARADSVLIGPGSKELMFLLQLVFYGELLVPTPCWVSYLPQATILGRRIALVPTSWETGWRITAELLDRHCRAEDDPYRPRILILNYPGNPEGRTYSAGELEALAEVARRYRVVLLSDEIYGRLHHRGEHASIGRFYPEGTIISSGLSKWCGAGGWRLGTFCFPPDLDWLLEAMAAVASETFTSVSAPIQYAAVRAFRPDVRVQRYLWQARRILAALGLRGAAILRDAGARVHDPEGGFYLFPDLTPLADRLAARDIATGRELCERLLKETGVAALPGSAFGRPAAEPTLRLAYVDFDGAAALTAAESIPAGSGLDDAFVERWCGTVLEGLRRLAGWLTEEN
jgi:aspartate aminotransferase